MAGSVNKVILIGNLGADPEVKTSQDGTSIVRFSIATSEQWKDKNTGEKQVKTEWHRIVIFNENLAKIASQYLQKGSSVYLEGQLQTSKWQDQNGQDRYSTDVVLGRFRGELTFLGGRGDTSMNEISDQSSPSQQSKPETNPPMGGAGDLDDDIPF